MRTQTATLLASILLAFSAVAFGLPAVCALAESGVSPPGQPESGPGGAKYAYGSVVEHSYGQGDYQFWLFEPADPKAEALPVVIFNHGWSAMKPRIYEAWIDHIVRRGNIVIYPRYQGSLRTKPSKFQDNAIQAIKDALKLLDKEPGHTKPMLDKVAMVGHSAGGQISAGIAARAQLAGLPQIKAVMCVQPGKSWGVKRFQIPLCDLSSMPASTLLLCVVGDRDQLAKDIDAKHIFNEAKLVPSENKNYVTIVSDDHGSPPLLASHFCPTAPHGTFDADDPVAEEETEKASEGFLDRIVRDMVRKRLISEGGGASETGHLHSTDALDYYGIWKLFDALAEAAFFGKNREYALGNTPQQRYMGKWSDGVPVKELVITSPPEPSGAAP